MQLICEDRLLHDKLLTQLPGCVSLVGIFCLVFSSDCIVLMAYKDEEKIFQPWQN